MSQNLRLYRNLASYDDGKDLIVTSMACRHGLGFQFTVGLRFCVLTEKQAVDLISVLQKEIDGIEQTHECLIVLSDGSLIPENNVSEVEPKD